MPERIELSVKALTATSFTNTVLETGRGSADFPTVTIISRTEATGFTPEGDALITSEIEGATVLEDLIDPGVRAPMVAAAAALTGWRASWRMSPTGILSNYVSERPHTAPTPNPHKALYEASVVFPDVAIGVGATWQVSSQWRPTTVKWDRTATYRLRALDNDAATVEIDVVMRASSQALRVEPNATTRLTSGTASAHGEVRVPLHGLVPIGMGNETSELNVSIVRGRLRVTSTVRNETLVSTRPVPTKP